MNVVKYFTRPPPPVKEYYYDEDMYAVNSLALVFDQTPNP